MKELIEQLVEKINEEAESIYAYVNSRADGREVAFQSEFQSDVFDAPIVYDYKEIRSKKVWGRHGVYVFILTDDVDVTYEQVRKWGTRAEGAGFNGQWKSHEVKMGDCLYLGSCVSESLYSRLCEHYAENGTFTALKLNHPNRKIFLDKVEAIAFPIKKIYTEDEYRIILPKVEKKLHELLHPLVGSSRV